MKSVKFHADAELEMTEAAKYYESQQENLGKRFLEAVQSAMKRIQISPTLYPSGECNVRRCRTKTFPYGIVFRDQPKLIEIIAVMHLSRKPGYWRDRL